MSKASQANVMLNNGVLMPLVSFGTYKIKGAKQIEKCLDAAFKAGYRGIDTAGVYHNESDIGAVLGKLLEKHGLERKDVFITSKLSPNYHASSARDAFMMSLSDLRLDYLDLYLIHWPGVQGMKVNDHRNKKSRELSWQSLAELQQAGRVRAIGVSNYTVRHLKEMENYSTVVPQVLQVEYHPHLVQSALLHYCAGRGIHFQAYSSLGTSVKENQLLNDPVVVRIANIRGKTPAQILLNFSHQEGIGIIPKSTNPKHIASNIQLDFDLPSDDMKELKELDKDKHYAWDPSTIA